jgi:hypothetical protein
MNVVVFLGPTMPPEDAATLLPAEYRPPASRGDVYAAARANPWAIGIVDGYFHRVPSVLHKEILWAIAQGIQVYGAASMGALRAAELERFGMTGVGSVFEDFRDGILSDDDEVAVAHGPAEAAYLVGSEAMVNIRATLMEALRAGVITAALGDRLIGISKDTFYPRRTWERLLDEAEATGAPPGELRLLAEWLPRGRVDRKRLDAVAMLRRIAHDRAAGRRPPEVAFRFNSTTMWEELQASIDQGGPGD